MRILIMIVVSAVVAGALDYQSAQDGEQTYCDMVKQYKETRGEYGWPDYKLAYMKECVK